MKQLGLISEKHVLSERFHSVPAWVDLADSLKQDWDLKMALYAGVISNLDRNIGRLISSLESNNQLENTVIMFLSDNGACYEDPVPPNAPWSNHPTDGIQGGPNSFPSYGIPWANASNTPYAYFKSYLHEGGILTPLIIHYPAKIKKGMINSNTLGHISDIMPTVLELAGIDYPSTIGERDITPLAGRSFLNSFTNPEEKGRDTIFWEHEFHRAVRAGDWKLVSPYKVKGKKKIVNKWELYNLTEDPTEQNDLSNRFPNRVDEMSLAYENWRQKVGALTKSELKMETERIRTKLREKE
ncbi:MAG: sulfatase-like hydrolase/transferase [Ekhidna sp.]|nr:sulfatase-like hydrolase/transferase [Ekhidna sp.]